MSVRNRATVVTKDNPLLALSESYDEEIEPLLRTIDQIRSKISDVDTTIDLPSIVVLGEQSSGKSSVLEALSGINLPRGGQHMTTKCPLEIRMRKANNWHASLESKNKLIKDNISNHHDIGHYIQSEQDRITQGRDQISKQVLSLNVQAPWLPNLTLIDLPGIIQIASTNQDKSSVQIIEELIAEYLNKPSTIILAIIQSNNDIETSAAVKFAKMYDAEGERTIGILTKVDLVDRGAEDRLLDVFNNKRIPLKHGYHMVKCRTQEDIDNNIELSEALRKEEQFFVKSSKFQSIPSERRGCPALARLLTKELVHNIKHSIPRLTECLRLKIQDIEQQFHNHGIDDYNLLTTELRTKHITELLFTSMQKFRTELHKVEEGAQINNPLYHLIHEMNDDFYNKMHQAKIEETNLISLIKEAMYACQGPEPSDYILFRVTKTVCLNYIKNIRQPMEKYLGTMIEKTNHVISNIIEKFFYLRPNLLQRMYNLHDELEKKLKIDCYTELELLLEMEEAFVYADNHIYRGTLQQMKQDIRIKDPLTTNARTVYSALPSTTVTTSASSLKRQNDGTNDESPSAAKILRTNANQSSVPRSSFVSTYTRPHTNSVSSSIGTTNLITSSSNNSIFQTSSSDLTEEILEYKIRILATCDIICKRIILSYPQRCEWLIVRKQFQQLDLKSSILNNISLENLDVLMAGDPETEKKRGELIQKRNVYEEAIKYLQKIGQNPRT
ncbi:unnamed protein product [Didymodactylos carnosus]|uniref:Dynamin-type G domain-containing protein n=1 Tax=Didymodactylos carnosus TaxID=1234261 RepID=A0A813UQI2_9BILA|nr:unnamed protein product [Didymodactylos carnosus]CAF3618030.1 unnamed protein product [Didymodactylos carnosus]